MHALSFPNRNMHLVNLHQSLLQFTSRVCCFRIASELPIIRNGFASFIPPFLRPSSPSLPSPPQVAEPSSPQTAAGAPAAAGGDRARLEEEDGEAALGRKRDSGHKKGLETRHLMVQRRFYDLVLRRKQPENQQGCHQGGGQAEKKVAEASAH